MNNEFKLFDNYDCSMNCLGMFNSLTDVKQACRKWDLETDGEWCPVLYKYNSNTGHYEVFENWNY